MSWIILEGLDRTGKSTVAEIYKRKGYEIVHMSAPDKKYSETGYVGPSYLDDVLEMYMQYDNRKVVFDRSPYGELVWPGVYGREAMLGPEDFEVLQEFEDRNYAQRILMMDANTDAHWKRCVENKEPLNHPQFKVANALFNKLAHKYNFLPTELGDFGEHTADKGESDSPDKQRQPDEAGEDKADLAPIPTNASDKPSKAEEQVQEEADETNEQKKLEKANAINSILSKRIIKYKGLIFDSLESDIKKYLRQQLSILLGSGTNTPELTKEEIEIFKLYVGQLKSKLNKDRG